MRFINSFPFMLLSLLLTGLGIGWLVGLSVSPVVSIVITSVAGSAAAIIAAMSGLENQPKAESDSKAKKIHFSKISPVPIASLVVGIVAGSIVGIYVRSHNGLGNDPSLAKEVEQWTELGLNREEVTRRLFENKYSYRGWMGTDLSAEIEKWTSEGLTNEEVVRRLLESTYPVDYEFSTNTATSGGVDPNDGVAGVLFAVEATECGNLYKALSRSQEALVKELGKIESLKELPNVVNDPQILEKIVTEVLCP